MNNLHNFVYHHWLTFLDLTCRCPLFPPKAELWRTFIDCYCNELNNETGNRSFFQCQLAGYAKNYISSDFTTIDSVDRHSRYVGFPFPFGNYDINGLEYLVLQLAICLLFTIHMDPQSKEFHQGINWLGCWYILFSFLLEIKIHAWLYSFERRRIRTSLSKLLVFCNHILLCFSY
jgi:hypothetical protein